MATISCKFEFSHIHKIAVPESPHLMNSARYHRVLQNFVVLWKIHMEKLLIYILFSKSGLAGQHNYLTPIVSMSFSLT